MTVEIVEVYEPQVIIEDVVSAGPTGPTGPATESMGFTKEGVLTAPFVSTKSWLLDGASVLEAFNVTVADAPTLGTLYVDLYRNGVSVYPAGVGRAALAIGINKGNGAVGVSLANNDVLTVGFASTPVISGAVDLVAVIRRRFL